MFMRGCGRLIRGLSIREAGLILFLALLVGCAVNPATKRSQLMLVSEEREFEIGQEVDKQVREEMGVYLEKPQLRQLVKAVGENLGRNSDRPNLIYRIEIVDDPSFNAFALPGGFVYVHRGALERLNSVDELASVLGHEVAHVAARHSAAMISQEQLLNLGLLGLNVATQGALQDYGQLVSIGAALAFNKFSRDAEREADYFGIRYMTRAGYNPTGALKAMEQIKRLEIQEPTTFETWFMTHPPTAERVLNLNREVGQVQSQQPAALALPMERNNYLTALEGMAVGEWNGSELVAGNRYYNKEYLLSLEVPEGWEAGIKSQKHLVTFTNAREELYAFFDVQALKERKTSATYAQEFEKRLERSGLRKVSGMSANRLLSHGALTGVYDGYSSRIGAIRVEAMAFVKDTNAYALVAFSGQDRFLKLQPDAESMINGLQFITQSEASQLQPPRLRIHRVASGETWASITHKYFQSEAGQKKLAEYNGFEASQEPRPGTLLKIPPTLRFL